MVRWEPDEQSDDLFIVPTRPSRPLAYLAPHQMLSGPPPPLFRHAGSAADAAEEIAGFDVDAFNEEYAPTSDVDGWVSSLKTALYGNDPVAHISDERMTESMLPSGLQDTRAVREPDTRSEIDVMTTSPKERRQARETYKAQTPGSAAGFQAAEAATKLNKPSTGDFVRKMLAKEGMEYEWGGTSKETGWDCSGIIYDIMTSQGFSNFPRTSGEIYEHSKKISLKKAIKTRGAILWHEGHIAVSLGNGKTIEAMGEAYGVVIGNAEGRFTHGGLLPELTPGKARQEGGKAKLTKIIRQTATPGDPLNRVTSFSSITSPAMVFGSVLGEMNSKQTTVKAWDDNRESRGLGFVPKKYRPMILAAAEQTGLSARLLGAIARHESINFDKDVMAFRQASSAGALGPMQVMPLHTATYGEAFTRNVKQNFLVGAQIFASYLNKAGGDLRLALAYYNAGPNASESLIQRRKREYSDPILDLFYGKQAA